MYFEGFNQMVFEGEGLFLALQPFGEWLHIQVCLSLLGRVYPHLPLPGISVV